MAAILGKTGDQSASVYGLAGKGERHFYFITRGIAALHMSLS
jgi:hypothetical protein